jgi:hypothetical protein
MSDLSIATSNAIMDAILGKVPLVVGDTVELRLYTTAPTDAGGGVECTRTKWQNYMAVTLENDTTRWPLASSTSNIKTNGWLIDYGTVVVVNGPETIVAWALWDGTEMRLWNKFSAPLSVVNGSHLLIPLGNITWRRSSATTGTGILDVNSDPEITTGDYLLQLGIPLYWPVPAAGVHTPGNPWTLIAAAGGPRVAMVSILGTGGVFGSTPNADWAYWITYLVSRGIEVYWYVTSEYTCNTVAGVDAVISSIFTLYPDITGIFFDETDATVWCYEYYKYFYDYVTQTWGKKIVNNPGAPAMPYFFNITHTIMDYESAVASFLLAAHTVDYTKACVHRKRTWNLIHTCTSVADMQAALKKANGLNVGIVFVTDATTNEYDTMFPSYFADELAELELYKRAVREPYDYPRCEFYYSAENVTYDGSNKVSVATNYNYLGGAMTQSNSAHQLLYVASAVNGLPVLRANGDEWLDSATSIYVYKDFTTIIVFKDNGTGINGRPWGTRYDGIANYIAANNKIGVKCSTTFVPGTVAAGSGWNVVITTWSNYNRLSRMWVNGVLANTTAPLSGTGNVYDMEYAGLGARYGGYSGGGVNGCFVGDIFAFGVWKGLMTTIQVDQLMSYYNSKLGLV